MPAPTTLTKIRAALKRLYPDTLTFQSDASALGLERQSIALVMARANDLVESIFDEGFPTTTTALIDRWELVTRFASVVTDSLANRRLRVISRLRKINGPRIDQLAALLSAPLALDPSDMLWFEQMRSFIELAVMQTTGAVSLPVPSSGPPLTLALGKPWPGVVDDTGVSVYIAMSVVGVTVATLTSPGGTVWTIPVNAATGWYITRALFVGEPAGGKWTLAIVDGSAPTLTEVRLLVSNNMDSARIYQFFVLRDPALPGTPDLLVAQRLLSRTALGHMQPRVVETFAFKTGDPHSLLGRDPLGV